MSKEKLYFIIMTIMLLCIGTPFTVFAGHEISQVNLLATEPAVNEVVDFNVTCQHPEAYYVDTESNIGIQGVRWYDITAEDEMKEGDIFQAGHEYKLLVQLAPKTGYTFALNTEIGVQSGVHGYVNWSKGKTFLSSETMRKIYVVHTYMIPTVLTEIEFHDVITPVAGQTPEYDAIPLEEGYCLSNKKLTDNTGISWYDLTEDRLLEKNDRFLEGHQYRISMYVVPEKGYEFAKFWEGKYSVAPYINGKKATISDEFANAIMISYDFEPCEKYIIDRIVLTDLLEPSPNAFAGYNVQVDTYGLDLNKVNNLFTKNGVYWHDVSGDYDLTTKETFVGGHVYEVNIRLLIEDNCTALKDDAGNYKGTATINGKEASVSIVGGELYVTCRFVCEEIKIDYIKIDDIAAPEIGSTPDYEASFGKPNVYNCGYDGENPIINWYEDGEWMYRTDKFKVGKTYSVEIYVEPVEVDGFRVGYFADELTATINGKKIDSSDILRLGNTVAVTYTFTSEETSTIRSVSIDDIEFPIVGNNPDYIAKPSEEHYTISTHADTYTKNGIQWKNVYTNKTMKVGFDYFEKGGLYQVYVTVHPAEGFRFATNPDGTPCINGYINGNEVDEVLGRNEYEAILVYSFGVNPFLDVSSSTYYFDPILWAVDYGITAGTGTYSFGPEEDCTRAQIVTFLWRAEGSPKPEEARQRTAGFVDVSNDAYYYDAVLWAVEKGITAGVTPDRFCPDEKCTRAQAASFIWRYAGQNEAESTVSPFADVPEYAYYYKAVLWAVENKITAGYTPTTFAPDDSCTRGQIVTFLYRYL